MSIHLSQILFTYNIFCLIFLLNNFYSQVLTQKKAPAGKNVLRSETTISKKLAKHGDKWHYGTNWPHHGYKKCGGQSQSPIRLATANTEPEPTTLAFRNYRKPIRLAYIENNGHTVQIGFSDNFIITVYGSASHFRGYRFKQMHFHWGSFNTVGSEHTIDGYRGPLEVHLVHYNRKYPDFDTAADKDDGLMVLGALYKISSRNNRFMTTVINLVKDVPKYKDRAFIMQPFTLRSILPSRLKPWFRYNGSLTTPPCYESVLWLVFKNKVNIGNAQEKQFRKCRSGDRSQKTGLKKPISNNYRPVQAINERQIFLST